MILIAKHLVLATRPKQWTKNLIIFFAFFFTVGETWGLDDFSYAATLLYRSLFAFVCFCILASSVYLLNDLIDADRDRLHPRKRLRPIAAGLIPAPIALLASLTLAFIGVALSFYISFALGVLSIIYFLMMVCYSLFLKHVVILDVMIISGGFVLRAMAGALVLDVSISPWLYICTSLGALFLGFSKRYSELRSIGPTGQRDSLSQYSEKLLEQLLAIVAPCTLLSYTLYTFTSENLPENHSMMLTIPFVLYGLFRYLALVHRDGLGEKPEEILLRDYPLLLNILLWLISASFILLLYR